MENLITQFKTLTPEQIVNQVPDIWGDVELLDNAEHFYEAGDKDREVAIYELVLRSPEVSEMVDNWLLYDNLVQYFWEKAEYQIALSWAYTRIAFDEQHEEGLNRSVNSIDLADIYFQLGEINLGISIYTQLLQQESDNLWLYTHLGRAFLDVRFAALAAAVLDEGVSRIEKESPDFWQEQFAELRDQAISQIPESAEPLTIIEPQVLAEFQAALKIASIPAGEVDETEAYPHSISQMMEVGKGDEKDLHAEIMRLGPPALPALIRLS